VSETSPHIIVLGAGLIGLCTAYSLHKKGAHVTLIDAQPGPCQGTSFSNSGMIHPSQAKSWAPDAVETQDQINAAQVTADLAKRSSELLRPLMTSLGLPHRPDGCVQIFPTLNDARHAQIEFDKIGITANILLDPIESLNQPACQFPDDFSGNAKEFGVALAAALKQMGVTCLYNIDNFAIRENGAFRFKVMAGDLRLNCDHIVLAAGHHTPSVLKDMGLHMRLDSIAGMALDFDRPKDLAGFPSCPIMDAQSRTALTIFADCIRISGGWNITSAEPILERWQSLAPQIMDRLKTPRSTWTGYRPVSPVGRPYISSTSRKGIWVNTGHGHMGWTLCAGSGALMAEMILDGRQDTRFSFVG